MYWIEKANRVWKALADDESRRIYDLWFEYLALRDEDKFCLSINELYDDWVRPEELDDADREAPLIICGCGRDGILTEKLLIKWGYGIQCFTDRRKKGNIDGIDIITLDQSIKSYKTTKSRFVVASRQFAEEIHHELLTYGIESSRIIVPKYGRLVASRGKQYYDVYQAEGNETFIDAGTYDGETISEFVKWTKGNFNRVIAIEPIYENYVRIVEKFKSDKRIIVNNNAAWNSKESINFSEDGAGSSQDNNGAICVQGISIDELIEEKRVEKVTYIKMDIEGSELQALLGARRVISKDKPKLAICLYHKPFDFIELGDAILDFCPDYRFVIRHYNSNMWETVLYAKVK